MHAVIDAATEAMLDEQQQLIELLRVDLHLTAVERRGTTLFVSFTRPQDRRQLMLRLRCDGWPVQPPSVDFVDPSSGLDEGPHLWPTDGEQAFKTTAQPRFVCLPGTREYQNAHGPVASGLTKPVTVVHQILMKVRS